LTVLPDEERDKERPRDGPLSIPGFTASGRAQCRAQCISIVGTARAETLAKSSAYTLTRNIATGNAMLRTLLAEPIRFTPLVEGASPRLPM